MEKELEFKIPTESLDYILTNGCVIENGKKYAFVPYWYEVVDENKGIVKMHDINNLPKDLEELNPYKSDFKRVYVTEDIIGRSYIIPYELLYDFNKLREDIFVCENIKNQNESNKTDLVEYYIQFEGMFSKYRTGGDINLIELYARI